MSVLSGVNLHLVDTVEKAMDFKRWLGERRSVLGVDTETGGFSPERDRLRMMQFGDLGTGWAIPYELWGGVGLEAMRQYDGEIVLHNSKFDARFITKKSGIEWPWHRTNDTMTMAHLIDPLRPKGLKPLAAKLVDPQAVAAQRLLDDAMSKNKWTWDTVPWEYQLYWVYGAMDPVLTCHIYEQLAPEVKSSYAEPYELEMGTTRVIAKMEELGARVDLDYAEDKARELTTWAQAARAWLMDTYHLDPTPAKLIDFFRGQGAELTKMTKSGINLAMDKEVLVWLANDPEQSDEVQGVAKLVLNIRKAEKNVGPYFKNFIALADENDRVHPNIWTMGTRTARMSITEPALQTLPRKDPTVRTAFVPSDDNDLITCDYDQIEARLMAHFSEDAGLVNAFTGDDDFFCTVASRIFDEPIDKKDERRQLTKNSVYGKMYGAGVAKMAETAGVPFATMERVVAGFDAMFPGVRLMQRKIDGIANQRLHAEGIAYITTPTGRRLVADDGKGYTLTNYLIQSHAAEILKRKIVELDAILPSEARMILPVHDELVFDVPRSMAAEVRPLIEETMRDDENYRVPITASSDLLENNWGDKYRT